MHPVKPGVFYQNGGTFPSNDNPNYIIQVGNVFGFIISIENVLQKTKGRNFGLRFFYVISCCKYDADIIKYLR